MMELSAVERGICLHTADYSLAASLKLNQWDTVGRPGILLPFLQYPPETSLLLALTRRTMGQRMRLQPIMRVVLHLLCSGE
jgi:hypothetical protein